MQVRVAVLARIPAIRRGWSELLGGAFVVTEEPDDIVAWAQTASCRAILLIAESTDELSLLAESRIDTGEIAVVVLLPEASDEQQLTCLRSGAAAAGRWDSSVEEVEVMLQAAIHHLVTVPSSLASKLAEAPGSPPNLMLSDMDRELLRGLVAGATVLELAARIGYSDRETSRRLKAFTEGCVSIRDQRQSRRRSGGGWQDDVLP